MVEINVPALVAAVVGGIVAVPISDRIRTWLELNKP